MKHFFPSVNFRLCAFVVCLFLFNNSIFAQTSLPGSTEVPTPQVLTICEGEVASIECGEHEIIRIVGVFWGRDTDVTTCSEVPTGLTIDSLCEVNSEYVLQKIIEQCKDKRTCEITASNTFFDNSSCGNVYKILRIKYECVPDESHFSDILDDGN